MFSHGELGDDAVGLALLRAIAKAVAHAVARRLKPDRRAFHPRLPAIGALGAEHQPRRLGPARTEQSGEAEDFAFGDVEAERLDRAFAANFAQFKKSAAVGWCRCGLRNGFQVQFAQFFAHHFGDELKPGESRHFELADKFAVAQHSDAI